MTREEYESLLQSDYWKGYSYSLIKERNFTCEDCGRRYPNERNKLQVHHLVYRDVNPWSYKPEELIVLCEECHRRRHGIMPKHESSISDNNRYDNDSNTVSSGDLYDDPFLDPIKAFFLKYGKYILVVILLLSAIYFINKSCSSVDEIKQSRHDRDNIFIPTSNNEPLYTTEKQKKLDNRSASKKNKGTESNIPKTKNKIEETTKEYNEIDNHADVTKNVQKAEEKEESTIDVLNRIQHERVVKQAKEAGVSTEGSTIDILDRMQHARVVKQAKEAGVSTEGSTIDILDRMQHERVVKQAKEAGVSTEGSTIDILDRIQHARVVKQAKEAGVSTEGSTLDILDRIQRKRLEKYTR